MKKCWVFWSSSVNLAYVSSSTFYIFEFCFGMSLRKQVMKLEIPKIIKN